MAATAALIAGAVAATAGAIGSSVNNSRARAEENRSYKEARDFLNSQYYRDPLSTVGNRALLKSMGERLADQQKAIENRAVAGGATVENQLAARQANNETMSRVYTGLLQGEDARRDRINAQKLGLGQQHSAAVQGSYRQDAQNWQAWGQQIANAAISYGTASLLSGAGSAAGAAAEGADTLTSAGLAGLPADSGFVTVPQAGLAGYKPLGG